LKAEADLLLDPVLLLLFLLEPLIVPERRLDPPMYGETKISTKLGFEYILEFWMWIWIWKRGCDRLGESSPVNPSRRLTALIFKLKP
jgi:hypothetical protein